MPDGRTHDVITFLLAPPAFAAAFAATGNVANSFVVTAAFLFGGVMFGPDLDTVSRQYSRWGVFRWLWYPYRAFFSHRSRFSHGLLLGALIRVIYFMGAVSLVILSAAYIAAILRGGQPAGFTDISGIWAPVGNLMRESIGENALLLIFNGLWAGAASHTFTDLAGTFIKTGRTGKFF